jgi:hypothetical protein
MSKKFKGRKGRELFTFKIIEHKKPKFIVTIIIIIIIILQRPMGPQMLGDGTTTPSSAACRHAAPTSE